MDDEGPKVIGWTVDERPCEMHGGAGLGWTIYVQMPNDEIVRAWWCMRAELPHEVIDIISAA